MSNNDETPESMDDAEIEGVDSDDLEHLDVDPDALDEDSDESGEDAEDAALPGEEVATEAAEGDEAASTDEERLNLDDDEDEKPKRRAKTEEDENEFASADDEEADLATILNEKLRSGEDLPPEDEAEVVDTEDNTDGTVLLQPRRPDEEHCQQCYLLVRKSAPKCPEDHDLCPLFPTS
ncbi:MAG: hypothetical protein ACO3EQ_01420 [Ilumatobacteraceae bacterium]